MLARGGATPGPPARPSRRFRYLAVSPVGLRSWLLAVGRRGWLLAIGLAGVGVWLLAVGLAGVGLRCLAVGLSARRGRFLAVGPLAVGADSRFLESGRRGARWVFGGTIGQQSLHVMAHSLTVAPLVQGRQDYSVETKEISCFL